MPHARVTHDALRGGGRPGGTSPARLVTGGRNIMLWFLLGMSVGTCLGALVVGICRASSTRDDRSHDDAAHPQATDRSAAESRDDTAPRLMHL